MKKILPFLLFSLLCSPAIFSQCQGYDYVLHIFDFYCDDESGTICFETNGDWLAPQLPSSACTDYVIEIVYQYGDFIYTDLDDFVEESSDPHGDEVLRYTPTYITDATILGCLDGVLQTPNTTFTLRVVDANDPNDIIATQTFVVDDIVEVGSSGTTTELSDLIQPNGPLLPAVAAAVNPQRIVVNGTLEVDMDYTIGAAINDIRSEIIMEDNARIEITENHTFTLFRTSVHGCTDNWDRINVGKNASLVVNRSSIAGADVAIELQD